MKPYPKLDIGARADVDGALQMAIKAALTASTPLSALVKTASNSGVYDRVPVGATFPYVTIPDMELIEAGAEGITIDEINLDLHVWSRNDGTAQGQAAGGSMQARAIVAALRGALDGAELELGPRHVLVSLHFDGSRNAGSDDPLTVHFVATFTGTTETP